MSRRIPQAMWPWLVALAGLLLLLDIAARRLAPPRVGSMMTRVVTTGAPTRRPERGRPTWVPPTPKAPGSAEEQEDLDIPEERSAPVAPSEIPEESYAGRLLAARRSARKKMDQDP